MVLPKLSVTIIMPSGLHRVKIHQLSPLFCVAGLEAGGDLHLVELVEGQFDFAGCGVVLDCAAIVAVEDLVEFGEVFIRMGVAALFYGLEFWGSDDTRFLLFHDFCIEYYKYGGKEYY